MERVNLGSRDMLQLMPLVKSNMWGIDYDRIAFGNLVDRGLICNINELLPIFPAVDATEILPSCRRASREESRTKDYH
jgi:hypothetical protein